MKTSAYLAKSRNGVYYARFVVPLTLRGVGPGFPREIRISTCTKDSRFALVCVRALRVAWDGLVGRREVSSPAQLLNALRATMSTLRRPLHGTMSYDVHLPDGTVIRGVQPGDEESVAKMLRISQLRVETGLPGTNPATPATGAVALTDAGVGGADDIFPGLVLSKASMLVADWLPRYLDDVQAREDRGVLLPKSREAQEAKLDIFHAYCGKIRIGTISATFMKKYESELAFYPSNREKRGLLPGTSVRHAMECVKAGTVFDKKGQQVKGLSKATVDAYMSATRQFLAFCADEGAVTPLAANPAHSQHKKQHAEDDTSRLPFDLDDMRRLFDSPFMREREYEYPAQYWVPHIAAFTGMRLNEICQLLVSDVFQEPGGVWMLNLADDRSLPSAGENTQIKLKRRLKTAVSRRQIPVHSKLVELGLVAMVQARKAAGNETLFDLDMDARDGMGQSVGRWFSRYLRGVVGIKDKRKVFHCFRHAFVTEVAQTIVDASVNKALPETQDNYPESQVLRSIAGHSDAHPFTAETSRKDIHTKTYMHGSTTASKQRVMERLVFDVKFTPYVEPPPKSEVPKITSKKVGKNRVKAHVPSPPGVAVLDSTSKSATTAAVTPAFTIKRKRKNAETQGGSLVGSENTRAIQDAVVPNKSSSLAPGRNETPSAGGNTPSVPAHLSPRIRADYLLLLNAPLPRQCLEAFATEEGVNWCASYPCVIEKASQELPGLPELLQSLPAFLVAEKVSLVLSGAAVTDESFDVTGLF